MHPPRLVGENGAHLSGERLRQPRQERWSDQRGRIFICSERRPFALSQSARQGRDARLKAFDECRKPGSLAIFAEMSTKTPCCATGKFSDEVATSGLHVS